MLAALRVCDGEHAVFKFFFEMGLTESYLG